MMLKVVFSKCLHSETQWTTYLRSLSEAVHSFVLVKFQTAAISAVLPQTAVSYPGGFTQGPFSSV